MIKIYHYSNKDFRGYIKPDFFSSNSYSGNSQRISGVKRSYFYLEAIPFERQLEGKKYLYIAQVNKNKIYDIVKDNLRLLNKSKTATILFNKLIKLGYIGILGHTTYKFEVISLFKAIKIKGRKTLTKV